LSVAKEPTFSMLDDIKNFDLNKAHCFGANEEYELRAIMHDVGIERLIDSLEILASKLRAEEKRIKKATTKGAEEDQPQA